MVSLGLANLPIEFDTKVIFTLEADVNRIFETNIKAAAIIDRDMAILWHDLPYLKYEQTRLDENFSRYFEGMIMSNKTKKASYYEKLRNQFRCIIT